MSLLDKKEFDNIAKLDEVAEDGCYAYPSNKPRYDLRAVLKEQEKLGRQLTEEEFKKFEYKD